VLQRSVCMWHLRVWKEVNPIADNALISMNLIMDILFKFENQALQAIKIDASIKCDNYDSVCRLTMVQRIRKAITAANQSAFSPSNPHNIRRKP
jgi:hypothetical protein